MAQWWYILYFLSESVLSIYIENKITKYFILFFRGTYTVRMRAPKKINKQYYIIIYNYYESVIAVHSARAKCV